MVPGFRSPTRSTQLSLKVYTTPSPVRHFAYLGFGLGFDVFRRFCGGSVLFCGGQPFSTADGDPVGRGPCSRKSAVDELLFEESFLVNALTIGRNPIRLQLG